MFTRDDVLVAAKKIDLSKEEQEKLLRLIKKSDVDTKKAVEAKKKLKQKLRPLILAVVEKYTKSGVSLAELTSSGKEGLDEAIDRWDINKERNYPFSYYAAWYIRSEIHNSLGLPTDVEGYDEVNKIKND